MKIVKGSKGSTLVGSLLSSHGLTEGFCAALPRSPRPLVRKELIAACPGGSLPGRTFLVDRNIGTWMLGAAVKIPKLGGIVHRMPTV